MTKEIKMADGKVDSGPAGQSSYQQLLDELPRTGPGTRGGEMLRRYWHPVCLSANLQDIPIAVRMLSENRFRDGKAAPVSRYQLPSSLGLAEYAGGADDGLMLTTAGRYFKDAASTRWVLR
jgi:hypothetical protein